MSFRAVYDQIMKIIKIARTKNLANGRAGAECFSRRFFSWSPGRAQGPLIVREFHGNWYSMPDISLYEKGGHSLIII